MRVGEKGALKPARRASETLSLVRFNYNICRIAAISLDFRRNEARFLCVADCVAERGGFEPSVQVRIVQEALSP
jgi:hypothetical protein